MRIDTLMRLPATTPSISTNQTMGIPRLRAEIVAVTAAHADMTASLCEVLAAATAEKVIEFGTTAMVTAAADQIINAEDFFDELRGMDVFGQCMALRHPRH